MSAHSHGHSRLLSLLVSLLALFALAPSLAASPEGAKPALTHTLFDNLPARILYFDDSSSVLYHDQLSRNVWRSTDEGKSWKIINGVPKGEAYVVVEHPWDNKIAFILSPTTTHYRTLNRGETWQSFVTPLAPSLGANTLAFHAKKWDWILFTGQECEDRGGWSGRVCSDTTYYTQDAFSSAPKPLLSHTSRCIFAHDKKDFAAFVPDETVYCAAFDQSSSSSSSSPSAAQRSLKESRLYSSTDFFKEDKTFVDLGIGRSARGVVGIGGVQKFLVAALKPSFSQGGGGGGAGGGSSTGGGDGEMVLYVTEDAKTWSRAQFPHGHGLRENAYTIVESTPHSLLIDVNSSPSSASGTLFTSNSNGTYFVRSLENTNRNKYGIVDFETVYGVEGVAIVNTVNNVEAVESGREAKRLKTRITFDDGGHWSLIKAPSTDHEGRKVKCDVSDVETCSLHLHSVTQPHNYGRVFSTPAPGLVMGVGTVGSSLLPYDECDTFLSTDGGITWKMVEDGAMKYEFGALGSVIVMVEDEEPTDELKYSFDMGKTWYEFDLGVTLRARLLTTVPDSTSLSFVLLGTLTHKSKDKGTKGERHVIVHMDFESLGKRKCGEGDMEKWYARKPEGENADCLMGHKQWFSRRKPDADCVVAEKWKDPVGREENCPCEDEDYECDYNFAPDEFGGCVPVGPEPVPAGQCKNADDKFLGSSGYRLIPGNTCDTKRGINKDKQVTKPCHAGQATPGLVTHQTFTFPGLVLDQSYFGDSHTILAFTSKNRVWQSSNEGFSWNEAVNGAHIVAMTMHGYAKDRAYLVTETRTVHYTTDKGASWNTFTAPADPNGLGIPLLDFHPLRSDWLIWTGQVDCAEGDSSRCRAVAYYTRDNGRNWAKLDEYVRICSWARDKKLKIDEKTVFCESYRDKKGSQRAVYANNNPLQLVVGDYFYTKKKTLFEQIVGFATFEEYMVVAETYDNTRAIGLKVSMDGKNFALARFPPNMQLENQAYTVLESTTDSIFLHVTTHPDIGSEWGTLFKSNSNGTYYNPSIEVVNRNSKGFVDFEKMIGLDGIAVINIVSNPEEAALSSNKKLQTRITHNDGGKWKPLIPPAKDVLGRGYECSGTNCALHIHGYTERKDPRATYSSPSAVGLMLAVGNVGEHLVPYADSDTFLTRDGGFTWEEVHKDAHIWEYGDAGSILVLANDEDVTDHVTYTLNEGLSWQDYTFGAPIRVKSIVTVPQDTSRRFILFGTAPDRPESTVAVHLDFSSISNVRCKLDPADPANDDFELWSPSESREEPCLFGMQALYHRRIRDRQCYVGEHLPQPHKIEKYCACTKDDYECEFNYKRDSRGECVLVQGAQPLASEQVCPAGEPFWYERTNYRRIPHTKCVGGLELDKGSRHACPNYLKPRSGFVWASLAVLPFGIAALAALWWNRRRSGDKFGRSGRIRLPEPGEPGRSTAMDILISVPWFIVGVVGVVVEKVRDIEIPWLSERLRRRGSRGGYRRANLDLNDAALLEDYEDDDF